MCAQGANKVVLAITRQPKSSFDRIRGHLSCRNWTKFVAAFAAISDMHLRSH
jgi:hypothetical protein